MAGLNRHPSMLSSWPERFRLKIEEKPRYIELLLPTEIPDAEKLVEEALRNAIIQERAQRNQNDRSQSSRLGQKVLVFAERADGFLKVFTGVMDIVKGIDPHIGGIVYGMVSLLASLGNSMQLKSDLAGKALVIMAKWFHRVKKIVEIHSDIEDNTQLLEGMEGVYSEALKILASVTRHYMRPGWKKVFLAIGRPPQVHFQPMLETFKEKVADFMVDHEILQASKFRDLLQQNTRETQQHTQDRETERMQRLAEWLGLRANSGDVRQRMISRSRERHASRRSNIRLRQQKPRKLTQANFDLLRHRESYKKWNESQTSALLLLSGQNRASDLTDICWLSPLAVEVVERLPDSAFFLFISTPLLQAEESVSVSKEALVLKVLLYQLLFYNISLYNTLLTTMEIHQKVQQISRSENTDTTELIFESIQMLLKMIPAGFVVHIILDGVVLDQASYLQDRWGPLRHVAQLVCDLDLKATVKCLGIADSKWWTELEDQCTGTAGKDSSKLGRELGLRPNQYSRLLTDLKWDQEIMENKELESDGALRL